MDDLKNVIVTRIMTHWSRDGVAALADTLSMLLTVSDFYDTDLVAIRLLHEHNLADAKWLAEWLAFKRNRLARLLTQANQIASQLPIPELS